MGKCGGRELNYVSDVDVIFVVEPARRRDGGPPDETATVAVGTQLATGLMRACSASTAEGTLWPVDAALRPEGKNGPLVRTVESHRPTTSGGPRPGSSRRCSRPARSPATSSWGRPTWTRSRPLVWQAAEPRQLRRGRAGHAPPGGAARAGDRGRPPAQARARAGCATSSSASSCCSSCTAAPTSRCARARPSRRSRRSPTAATSAATTPRRSTTAYRLLRTLEHRIQLFRLRRTHLMPTDEADLRRLGRAVGHRRRPGAGGGRAVAGAGPRGAPAARAAVLPAAARPPPPG